MTGSFRPLVVGAPRSGFALLCSIASEFVPLAPSPVALRQRLVNVVIDLLGDHIAGSIVRTFAEAGIREDLIYSPVFRHLTGGPKWLNPDRTDEACIRKYIGVRGLGDFTLVVAHPRAVFERDEVVHSHSAPKVWASHPGYRAFHKLASVRSPIGTINSALFSLNALASEYIQRFVPPERDDDRLRQELAVYKMTDLRFFEGLVRFYRDYLTEFLAVRERYSIMRWEDLITAPEETIGQLANGAGIPIAPDHAAEIWRRLDHVNLTGAHKHNYRQGKGKVGDWKNWITNRHLEIMRAHGIEAAMGALGYGPIEFLDEARYTPFQRRVHDLLARGAVYGDFPDRDLFGFAFNKSNIDAADFDFRRYPRKNATQIERSSFADEALLLRVWDTAEMATVRLNRVLAAVLAGDYGNARAVPRAVSEICKAGADFAALMPNAYAELVRRLDAIADEAKPGTGGNTFEERPPRLVRTRQRHNIVGFRGQFYVVPHAAGALDLQTREPETVPGAVHAPSFAVAEAVIGWLEQPPDTPRPTPVRLAAVNGCDLSQIGDVILAAPAGTLPDPMAPPALAAVRGLVAGQTREQIEQLCAAAERHEPVAREAARGGALRLDFVADDLDALGAAAEALAAGGNTVCVRPWNARAQAIAQRIRLHVPQATILTSGGGEPETGGVIQVEPRDPRIEATVLLHGDGEALAAALMDYLDLANGTIVAPITARHSSRLPLFLISIPKAGTHLLFELVRAMGYRDGGPCPDARKPGHWHYLEYSNAHTAAPDFFVDTVRRSPFGNRAHPFPRTPTVFIYRHPLDVLVSEANYYHEAGNTVFGGYLAALDFNARIHRLIDDPWLLGNLRDRIGRFAAWLEFPNVLPVSFEELVGEAGGGDPKRQQAAIWSLQLRLQVGGSPDRLADAAFNTASATFRTGQIGAHREALDAEAWQRLRALPTDYVEVFGYAAPAKAAAASLFSRRIDEFRTRPLQLASEDFATTPILVEADWRGHNIVRFRHRFFAIPTGTGALDLSAMSAEALTELLSAADLSALKLRVDDKLRNAALAPIVRRLELVEQNAAGSEQQRLARRLGAWLGYELWDFEHHVVAVPRTSGASTPLGAWPAHDASLIVGHSRSGLMLRIVATRLRRCWPAA